MNNYPNNLTGYTFGRLTVVKRGESIGRHTTWLCKCSCGNPDLVKIRTSSLTYNRTKSCGCLRRKNMHNVGKITAMHNNCIICGSSEYYAKDMCKKCYEKHIRKKYKAKEMV